MPSSDSKPQKASSVYSYESVSTGAARQSAEPPKTSCSLAPGDRYSERTCDACEPAIFEIMKMEKTSPCPMLDVPSPWRERAELAGPHARARLVADYIAGMTDRFALDEHRRLFDLYE